MTRRGARTTRGERTYTFPCRSAWDSSGHSLSSPERRSRDACGGTRESCITKSSRSAGVRIPQHVAEMPPVREQRRAVRAEGEASEKGRLSTYASHCGLHVTNGADLLQGLPHKGDCVLCLSMSSSLRMPTGKRLCWPPQGLNSRATYTDSQCGDLHTFPFFPIVESPLVTIHVVFLPKRPGCNLSFLRQRRRKLDFQRVTLIEVRTVSESETGY